LDKTHLDVFLNEFLKSLLFRYQKKVYRANQRLSTFFQIDLKIIRIMRSKDFSFGFAENIGKFKYSERTLKRLASTSFVKLV